MRTCAGSIPRTMVRSTFFTFLLIVSCAAIPVNNYDSAAIPYDPGFDIRAVIRTAVTLPIHSWEFGTASEALLELYDAKYSVYGSKPFPVPTINLEDSKSLTYAKQKIVIGAGQNALSDGDGAVGDPASLGVSAVLLGKTLPEYAKAAKVQAEYVYGSAPRYWNGAISHRADHPELWWVFCMWYSIWYSYRFSRADFIYMAPPFLAYYGVATDNATTLKEAVDQCLLYRQILHTNTTANAQPPETHPPMASGLWQHIIGPSWGDHGLWSTGNAWAAAGMTRVLATLLKAPTHLCGSWKQEAVERLTKTIQEILDAVIRNPKDTNGLVRNYIDDSSWFGEVSGSSLFASVAYRIGTMSPMLTLNGCILKPDDVVKYIAFAEGVRKTLGNGQHISSNGTVTPAINPLNWGDRQPFTQGSPEGNNFVVLLYAAWRDCIRAGIPGCEAPYS